MNVFHVLLWLNLCVDRCKISKGLQVCNAMLDLNYFAGIFLTDEELQLGLYYNFWSLPAVMLNAKSGDKLDVSLIKEEFERYKREICQIQAGTKKSNKKIVKILAESPKPIAIFMPNPCL
jgi:hypothetical protein